MASLEDAIAAANVAIENAKKLTTKDRKGLKSGTFCLIYRDSRLGG
jgi:hypothetical protein